MKVTTYIIEDAVGSYTLSELVVSYGDTLRLSFIIYNTSGSTLTVFASGSDTIDGAGSVNLAADTGAVFVGQYGPASDGIWHQVISGGGGGGGGGGSVTSVGLSLPAELTVSGSPITSAGTLAAAWASETTNKVLASPNGSSGTPAFRGLVAADVPNLDAAKITTGVLPIARIATGTPSGTQFVRDDGTLAVPSGVGIGTVTSVGLTVPSDQSVSGSPITSSGTLAVTDNTQSANTVKAGPSSGSAATPSYRALVAADIPTIPESKVTNLASDLGSKLAIANNLSDVNNAGASLSNIGGAPSNAHYLTTQAESGLSAETSLGALASGLLKQTVSAGVSTPAIAVQGTDFYQPGGTDVAVADGGTGSSTASGARTNLGVAIGSDVQAHDSDLDTIAGLTATTDDFMQAKASAWTTRTPTQVTADLIPVVGDSGSGGTKGLVPAPSAGDASAGKFLKADGTFAVPPGTHSGTVTSVALTVPTGLTVSGSPITAAGTLAVTEDTQSANLVKAGPASGSAATPTYRSLVAADIPALAESKITNLTTDLAAKLAAASNLSDVANAATARGNLGVAVQSVSVSLNNGTSALTAGQYVDFIAEYPFTITQNTLLADQSGSVVLDIRKCTYSAFDDSAHPVSGDSICASAKPTISSAVKSQDATLTGWTTSGSAGDVFRVIVVSATSITQVTMSLKITRA